MPVRPDAPREPGADLHHGDRIGHFVLGDEIGRGGMGVVYRAHDPGLGRDVAVKVLPPGVRGDPERMARLRTEARAASALDHPNVCTVYEVGQTDPEPLYEMLTGRRPFDAPYEAALLYAVLHEDPPPLAGLRPDVPEALAAVVARLLAKRPADRFATADEAAVAIGASLTERVPTAPAASHRAPVRRRWASTPWRWRAGIAAAVVLVVALAAWAVVSQSLPDEKHVAVLPFRTVGGGPEAQAFSDGLVETLASGLTQLEQYQGALWVVPASEVRAQRVESPSAARRMLGATLVVSGTVQRGSGRVRVLLNLVDTETLRQLRSATVDVPEVRLNTLTAEVAAALEEMLDIELRPEMRARLATGGTTSADAYDAFLQGLGYLDRPTEPGHVDQAIAQFEQALALDPLYALAHAQLGEAFGRRFLESRDERWLVRAEAEAREALALAPETAAVHALLSKVARHRGDTSTALASARRVTTLDPASDDAAYALAAAYDDSGDLVRAEQIYRLAVRRKPGSWLARMALGAFYHAHGRYGEAEATFREALPLAPDHADLLALLGSSLYMLSLSAPARSAEARAVFERSLHIRPTYEALSNLGTLYYDEGRFADAVRSYTQALGIDDADPLVWGNLASAYEALGRTSDRLHATREGIRRAETQLRATPRDADLLVTLAVFYADVGRTAEARRMAMRAAALTPTVDAQADLATVFARTGDAAAGCRWLEQALAEGFPRETADADSTLGRLQSDCGTRPTP